MATTEDKVFEKEPIAAEVHGSSGAPKDILTIPNTENIESLLKAIHLDEAETPEQLVLSPDVFKKIKDSLLVTLESMKRNQSLLTRAAKFWGELPLWQKILGGLVLTAPTLVLGIVAHLGFLLIFCGVALISYIFGSVVLDDHHRYSVSDMNELAKGIIGLADLLELTITALDTISQKLTQEVGKFSEENEVLRESNQTFQAKTEQLAAEILQASKLNESLKITKDALEHTAKDLSDKFNDQNELLNETQNKLRESIEAYNASQELLIQKIAEFSKMKSEMDLQLDKSKLVVATLQAAVTQFSSAIIPGQESQDLFKDKLQEFLTDKGASFDKVADRISEAEKKLAETEARLKQCSQLYEAHLKELERQIERFSGATGDKHNLPHKTIKNRSQIEFFSNKNNPNITPEYLQKVINNVLSHN